MKQSSRVCLYACMETRICSRVKAVRMHIGFLNVCQHQETPLCAQPRSSAFPKSTIILAQLMRSMGCWTEWLHYLQRTVITCSALATDMGKTLAKIFIPRPKVQNSSRPSPNFQTSDCAKCYVLGLVVWTINVPNTRACDKGSCCAPPLWGTWSRDNILHGIYYSCLQVPPLCVPTAIVGRKQ